ncbi:MAG TPA: hypothetical protein ENI07_11335 [Desulfobacterales bacterium]|nr:hypothetical protein [Desulfobacterales bacterium]
MTREIRYLGVNPDVPASIIGISGYGERVHDRVIKILETETGPLLNETTYKELSLICELADTRHKDEELDVKMFV